LTVGNNWGATGSTAYLYVPGTVNGQVTVVGDGVDANVEAYVVGATGQLDFQGDFEGALLVPYRIDANGVVQVAHDALAIDEYSGIEVGYLNDPNGVEGVYGHLSVGGELHMPLEVRAVVFPGSVDVGSIPDPNPWGINTLGIYGPLSGSVTVDGELDGECVVYYVQQWGWLAVTGDMTALFEVMVYGLPGAGYINQGGLVEIDGAMSGGYLIDNIYAGGELDAGSLASAGTIGYLGGNIATGDVNGDCTIDYFASTASLEADGELGADYEMRVTHGVSGSITIGTLSGTLYVADELTSAGTIDTGDVSGLLKCADGAQGAVTVGNVTGTVDVGGPTSGPPTLSTTTARVTVDGSIGSTGQVIVGNLTDPGDANNPLAGGYVVVNGSLQSGGQIVAHDGLASNTAFIAINYLGGTDYSWEPNAPVILEHGDDPDEVFYANTPSRHIWEISVCRGDFNNDQAVGYGDLNPYIVARNSPADYAAWFPGLGGTYASDYLGASRLWHGDTNCDGTWNSSDDNPFVARIIAQCCDPDCPGCQGGRGEGGEGGEGPPDLPAEDLAAELAANIWPELFEDLLSMVAGLIDVAPNEETQAYWQAVYDLLTQWPLDGAYVRRFLLAAR
jgi:hypothetical protein